MAKGKILIVSSDYNERGNIRERLKGLGYQSIVAEKPENVSERLNDFTPDLYLVDIRLKTGTGAKKLKYRLSRRKNIPLLYYLPSGKTTKLPGLKKLKAYEYISITGTDKEIRTAIEAVLALAGRENISKKDITKKRRGNNTEHKLKEQPKTPDTLLSNLPGMAYRCLNDREWTMKFVSEGCRELTGYQPSELIDNKKTSYNRIIHPEDTDKVRECIQDAKAESRAYTITYRIYTRDKKLKWVCERGRGIFDESGDLVAIEGFISDITNRVLMEDRLKNAFLEKEMILDSLVEHVILEDRDMKIIWANKAACESLPMSRKEIIGRHCYELWAQRSDICPDCAVAKAIRTGKPQHLEKTTPDGRSWFIQGHPVYNTSGEIVAGIEVTLDTTEHRRAEKALEKSESKYYELYENLRDGFAATDLSGRITEFNPAFQKMLGYTREELLNKNYRDITPDKWYKAESQKVREQVLKKGYSCLFEKEYIRKDGTVFPVELQVYLIRDENNEPAGVWAFVRDITERKKAELALKDSEEKYRLLAETANDMIMTYNIIGQITYTNSALLELTGYNQGLLKKMNITALLPATQLSFTLQDDTKNDVLEVEPLIYEAEIITKNGRRIPVEVNSAPLIKESRVIGRLIIARDIRERQQAEQALKESEARYRRIIENTIDLIYTCSPEGEIFYISPQVSHYGYRPEEVVGHNIMEFTHPDDVEKVINDIRRTVEHRENTPSEFRFMSKDNTEHYVEAIGKVVSEGTDILQVTGVIRDITDRKLAERALLNSEEKYRLLIENANEGIFVVQDGEFKFFNPKAISITGYTSRECENLKLTDLVHEDDRAMVVERHQRRLQGFDAPDLYHFRIIDKSGNVRWLEINAVRITWENRPATLNFISDITERKEAEEAILKSEERFRTMADFTYDWESWIGPDGKYIYVSPSCERVTGYPAEEFMHDPDLMLNITHPDDREKVTTHLNDHLEVNRPHTFEFRIVKRDGSTVWIEHVCQPVYSSDGRYLGRRNSNRDTTERRVMLEALMESEEKYSTLIEKANDGVVIIQDETILFANSAMEKITGHTVDELQGRNYLEMVDPDSQETIKERYRQRLEGKQPPEFYEIKIRTKDERIKIIELSAGIIKYKGQTSTVGLLRDITDRRKTEEHVRRNLAALDAATDGIAIINKNLEYTYLNLAHARTYGYDSPFELIHNPFKNLYDENESTRFDREILPALERSGFWRGEFKGKKKDGTLFPVELSLTVLEEGGMISIVRDITEIKNTRKQQRMLKEKLERAERMESLGILAGGVAHDLNNMLGPMVAYSDLILEENDGNKRTRDMVEKIGKASRIAADIIQDLLTLARRGRYDMVVVNFNEVIETYLESPNFARLTKDRPEIELELNLDPSLGYLSGSPAHLSKVVMNLVINAFDAMPEGGKLTLETSREQLDKLYSGHENIDRGEYIVFKVCDTGTGIEPDDLPKIFEPYYSRKKLGSSGSGLGLAVVYGIIKDHHAYYDIFSEIDRGTEFIFYFPVSPSGERALPEDITVDDLTGNESILVVDDVESQREMAYDLLTSLGYRVTTVTDGLEAIDYMKENRVDLVVMDMILGKDYDGLDTYREILKNHPGQKALITSGYSATERVRDMQELGAGAYIRKPYTRRSLGRAVRSELDKTVKTELTRF